MAYKTAPLPGRPRASIRVQLTLVIGLVLLLASVVAIGGYLSLRRLQTGVQVALEEAGRIRELGLEVENEFLTARQNEANFLTGWRSLGFENVSSAYVTANQTHLEQARTQLDAMASLVQMAGDPDLRILTSEIDALRPLLGTYESAFQMTVRQIEERSQPGGVEEALHSQLQQLETAVTPLPNPEFLQLVLRIRAYEQAYLSTGRQEYVDNVRLLVNEFTALAGSAAPADLTIGDTTLSASRLVDQAQNYHTLFTGLVTLDRDIEVNTAIFREVTTDIDLITNSIVTTGETGLARARTRLLTLGQQAMVTLVLTAMLATGLGIVTVGLLARRIIVPLRQLSRAAEEMGRGRLEQSVDVRGPQELVTLAQTFETMASQLRETLAGLEKQVAQRTHDLERRAVQLQAAAEVARDAASARELDDLLNRAVSLVQERFGFYHAGIFLLGEDEEYAVLRAALSEGGQRMLAREHKLKVGEVGIVGYAAGTGEPRIALDVGEDAVFFDNPDLPDTRSEMALPLKVRDRVIGVLDAQSTEAAAFDEEDVAVLQTMADQLAVAIQNARLFQEMQQTVRELETASGRYTREAWQAERSRGYRYRGLGVEPASEQPPEARQVWTEGDTVVHEAAGSGDDGVNALAVPVKLRDQVLGVLDLRFEGEPASPETISLVEEVADRLALALESARLLEETQSRARREQTIRQITEQMRRAVDVETILQTTIAQLGEAMSAPRVYVRLGAEAEWSSEEVKGTGGDEDE